MSVQGIAVALLLVSLYIVVCWLVCWPAAVRWWAFRKDRTRI